MGLQEKIEEEEFDIFTVNTPYNSVDVETPESRKEREELENYKKEIRRYFSETFIKPREIIYFEEDICPECFKEFVAKQNLNQYDKAFLVSSDDFTFFTVLNEKNKDIRFKQYNI